MNKKLFTELKASIKEAGQIQRGLAQPSRRYNSVLDLVEDNSDDSKFVAKLKEVYKARN